MDTRTIEQKLNSASPDVTGHSNDENLPLIADDDNDYMTRSDCIAYTAASLLCGLGWAGSNIALQILYGSWLTRGLSFICIPLSSYGCSTLGGMVAYKGKKMIEKTCCHSGDAQSAPPEQMTSFKAPRLRI